MFHSFYMIFETIWGIYVVKASSKTKASSFASLFQEIKKYSRKAGNSKTLQQTEILRIQRKLINQKVTAHFSLLDTNHVPKKTLLVPMRSDISHLTTVSFFC